jgi:hypothetical protein
MTIEIPDAPEFRVDIEIPAGAELRGRVTSRGTGKPLAGVNVQAYGVADGGRQGGSMQSSATTDGDGRYALKGLAAGAVHVNVGPEMWNWGVSPELKKYMRTNATVQVSEGAAVTRDFALDEGGTVNIEVVDENGKAVPEAWVQVEPLTPPAGWGGTSGNSNDAGIATIYGVCPGRARASCQVQGYPPAQSAEFDVAVGLTARARIVLSRGVDVVLRVLGPDGSLVKPAWVMLRGDGGAYKGAAFSGSPGQPTDGTLTITAAPGTYRADVSFGGAETVQANVKIGDQQGATIDVKLEKLPKKK